MVYRAFLSRQLWQRQLDCFRRRLRASTARSEWGLKFPANLLVGAALHELTHAMGREPGAGPFDLFRYTSPGNHLFTSGSTAVPAYFSIDGGNTKLADFGQTSDASDFLTTGVQGSNDPFDEFYNSHTIQNLTSVDKELLDALGFTTTALVTTVIELSRGDQPDRDCKPFLSL